MDYDYIFPPDYLVHNRYKRGDILPIASTEAFKCCLYVDLADQSTRVFFFSADKYFFEAISKQIGIHRHSGDSLLGSVWAHSELLERWPVHRRPSEVKSLFSGEEVSIQLPKRKKLSVTLFFFMHLPFDHTSWVDASQRTFSTRFVFNGILGKGSFGAVGCFLDTRIGKQVAIKTFSVARDWWKEIIMMTYAGKQVKNCVWLEDAGGFWYDDKLFFWVAMPSFRPLPQWASQRMQGMTNYRVIWRIFATLIEALAHLHGWDRSSEEQKSLFHGDIKPSNILFNYRPDRMASTLCDFSVTGWTVPGGRDKNNFGTRPWRAPEIEDGSFKGETIEDYQKTDVWSAGVSVLACIVRGGKNPFLSILKQKHGLDTKRLKEFDGKTLAATIKESLPDLRAEAEEKISDMGVSMAKELLDCIFKCLETDPSKRPTSLELFNEMAPLYRRSINPQ